MNPLAIMALASLGGVALSQLQGAEEERQGKKLERKQRAQEADIARWAFAGPMQPTRPQRKPVNMLDKAIIGGIAGSQLGENIWYADALNDAYGAGDEDETEEQPLTIKKTPRMASKAYPYSPGVRE